MTAPTSESGAIALRLALPSELDVLVAIDDDASSLYAAHGVPIELAVDSPFARAERGRWRCAAEQGRAFIALDRRGEAVGFAALGWVDGAPYLDQLAVRRGAMRQGIGGRLLDRSAEWARSVGGVALWLTTYAHLPFNRAYYERHGYVLVPERECGPGVLHHLDEQRRHLPAPAQRVAMRRPL